MHDLNDRVNNRRIRQGRDIPQLILLARQNLSQNAAHNLARASLGQIRHDIDALRGRERSNRLSHLEHQLDVDFLGCLDAVLEGQERHGCLAGDLISSGNDCCLGDSLVLDQGCLDFSCRETVAADVDDVVNAATDPVESIFVTAGPVSGVL